MELLYSMVKGTGRCVSVSTYKVNFLGAFLKFDCIFEIGNPSDQRLGCKMFEWILICIIKYVFSGAKSEVIQLLCCVVFTPATTPGENSPAHLL